MYKILVTDHFALEAKAKLLAENLQIFESKNLQPTLAEIDTMDAMIIRSQTKIMEKLIPQNNSLKLIVTMTSGFDHMDLPWLQQAQVQVANTPQANAQSTAELAWSLIFATTKNLIPMTQMAQNDLWDRPYLINTEVHGKTLGLIGFGQVGKLVSKIAKAFAMEVIVFDPYLENSVFTKHQVARVGLSELITTADIISLHAPLNTETFQMMNQRTLQEMHPECILINTSRGELTHEQEISQMLIDGRLKAYGADVFVNQPLQRTSPLRNLKNAILTPHMGGFTKEAIYRASMEAADSLLAFFAKRPMANLLHSNQSQWWKNSANPPV